MSYRGKRKSSYGLSRLKRVHAHRSERAKRVDESLRAPIAKTPEQWLRAPNRFDLPNVDTPKSKKKNKSCRLTDKEFGKKQDDFDRLVNKDDLSDNPENKKAYNKILETLEKARIPYYIIPETRRVFVPIKNMEKAEKLTDKYYEVLKKGTVKSSKDTFSKGGIVNF